MQFASTSLIIFGFENLLKRFILNGYGTAEKAEAIVGSLPYERSFLYQVHKVNGYTYYC